jgi:hypothetical protein
MPGYFFHLTRDGVRSADESGAVFDDDDVAWREALAASGEIIEDEARNLLYAIHLSSEKGKGRFNPANSDRAA